MTLIIGAANTPEPPTEIVARLKRIHPALGLRFGDGIGGIGWKLTWEWQANDRRWERVLQQDIPPDAAHDVIGYLPMGCSIDEAPAYIEAHLKDYPREEVNRLRGEMNRWNNIEIAAMQTAELVTATMDSMGQDAKQSKGLVVSIPSAGPVKSRKRSVAP